MREKIISLLRLELLLEWRNKYALAGILVYVISCVLVVKFIIQHSGSDNFSPESFTALYWLVLLFSAVNAIANSIGREPEGRKFYFLWLTTPTFVITAKLVYNFFAAVALSVTALITFLVMTDFYVPNVSLFLITAIAGSCGYAFIFTTVGAIASGSKNNASLIAVMGLPLVVPLLIFIAKISIRCFQTTINEDAMKNLMLLIAFDGIIAALAYLLFPYLWRD